MSEITMFPCPACGSMLFQSGRCTNLACESYDNDDEGTDEEASTNAGGQEDLPGSG